MDKIIEILPFLIPIIIIQLSLQIYCIVNLVKRKKVRFDNKILWGIIILVFSILGCVSYLLLRGDEE